MKMLTCELVGYKRLALNNINYFKTILTEKIQLILGTNGSGKSSLLRELTPLPAIPADYTKEGHKIIEIEHRGHHYRLTSSFSPNQRHGFFKDGGEDLNKGGTASVQRELVKKEFNITPDVHDLLTGSTNFSSMGPAERRQWFTRLSDTNYNYAIGVYQRLKEKLRDISGAIKLNQARAVQETNKLLTDEQEKTLKAEIEQLTALVNELLLLKPTQFYLGTEIKKELNENDKELRKQTSLFRSLRKKFLNFECFNSITDIDNAIIAEQSSTNGLTFTIDQVSKEISEHQKTYDALSKSNVTSIKDINTKIEQITTRVALLERGLRLSLVFDNASSAQQALSTLQDTLSDIFTIMEPNIDKRYSRNRYRLLSEALTNQTTQLKNIDGRQLILIAQKKEQEHYKDHGEVVCPKCSHRWFKDYNEQTYKTIIEELTKLGIEHEKFELSIKETESELEKIKDYMTVYKSYNDIVRTWTILKPLWNHLLETEIIFNDPKKIIKVVEQLKHDLVAMVEIASLKTDLVEMDKLRLMAIKDDQSNLDRLKEKINELNETLFCQNEELRNAKYRTKQYREYKEVVLQLQVIESDISDLVNERNEKGRELVESLRRDAVNKIIQTVQLELSKKEQQLSRITLQRALVDSIQKQLKELEEEQDVLKVIVKELSPSDGLIAKGLMGFINNYVQQMNSFIRKVWLYPLELVARVPEADADIDLDYKFSLNVNNSHPVPDISKGSSAMKEIIDLSFRIVCMKYLGLSDAPLVLDEFARSMDPAHRQSAFYVITNLIVQSNFSQIFMVSHFDEFYGSLKNAEVTVMCDSNLSLPANCVYNKHVTIH